MSTFLCFSSSLASNVAALKDAHITPNTLKIKDTRYKLLVKDRTKAVIARGNREYPITPSDCEYVTSAPRTLASKNITNEPKNHIVMIHETT